jgi:hypothetical protein
MKKDNKIKNKYFLMAAICYYIGAIALFIGKNNNVMAVMDLCLGSCFLGLSMTDSKK